MAGWGGELDYPRFQTSITECRWILSSYDVPEVRKLYDGYHILTVQSASGMRVKKAHTERLLNEEVLITNFIHGDEPMNQEPMLAQIKLQI